MDARQGKREFLCFGGNEMINDDNNSLAGRSF
jgi:hypothetical protein